MMRTLSIALFSLGLMAGCSKKDDKKAEPAKTDPAAKPTDPAGTTPTTPPTTDPAKPADTTATPPAAGGAMDMAKAEALMTEMSTIIEKAGKDCDKMATDLKAFADKNKDTLKASKDFEKSLSPEDKKKWEEKGEAMVKKHGEAMGACMSNPKFGEAMKALADE